MVTSLKTLPPCSAPCSRCRVELPAGALDVFAFGGPLCDSCRDHYYYETDAGQLELINGSHQLELAKLQERIDELELVAEATTVHNRHARARDQIRIVELEAEIERLRLEWPCHPGQRLRPSPLS